MIRDPIHAQIAMHEAEEARLERRAEAIDESARLLLETENHPLREDNFYEALSEMSVENQARLRAAIAHGDDKAIGATLKAAVTDYWQSMSRHMAERIVDRNRE